jgi:hypothetical protein
MRTQSRDTDPPVEKVQIALLRAASIAQRVAIAFSLSKTVIRLARDAIRRQNPQSTDREIMLSFVAINYGAELAENLRIYLQRKST